MDPSTARHAFVTGGASGIGLALARALADLGVPVTIADVDEAALDRAVAQSGGRLRGQVLDVTDREGWARARQEAEAALGPVDLLINNAGVPGAGEHLADMAPESFDRVVAINLTGVFNGISTFGASLRAQGRGHVVNVSSMQGMALDGPGLGSYGASKAAVVALGEVLRHELAPHGVGVSVFCPGMTLTPMVENALRRQQAGGSLSSSLRVQPKSPEEVAQIVLRGIAGNLLYIVSHPERMAAVEQRLADIRADCNDLHHGRHPHASPQQGL